MINKITIIGSGNVAHNLAHSFKKLGLEIVEIYSRNLENAKSLAKEINCDFTNDLSQLNTTSDLYIIAVKDDAISIIASKLNLKNKLIVHTSGSVKINVLKEISDSYGSFYPLQTFTKEKIIDLNQVPICVEGNNSENQKIIELFAKSISKKVHVLNSNQRGKLHLAAVFTSNFSNFMQVIAQDICEKENIDSELLKPLFIEVYEKNLTQKAEKNQTGPAKRKDYSTMEKHLELLEDEEIKKFYGLVSEMIIKRFS